MHVAFPQSFQERRAVFIKELAERFGVDVVVVAKNTAGELAELARKHLPVGARLLKAPSLFPDGRVVLKVRLLVCWLQAVCGDPSAARTLCQWPLRSCAWLNSLS